ncbi:MAG: hypothetical protein RIQ64_331 [Actinomycetota bacterium]|jgi:hypothetical protein
MRCLIWLFIIIFLAITAFSFFVAFPLLFIGIFVAIFAIAGVLGGA